MTVRATKPVDPNVQAHVLVWKPKTGRTWTIYVGQDRNMIVRRRRRDACLQAVAMEALNPGFEFRAAALVVGPA